MLVDYKPTPEQFDKVIKTFEKLIDKYPPCSVNMSYADIGDCGTPMCHGGWYAYAYSRLTFQEGANLMAIHLGFDDMNILTWWASLYPEIWGNRNGGGMFRDSSAFINEDTSQGVHSLTQIVDHWKKVKERAHPNEKG